jgi:hypothetical protein
MSKFIQQIMAALVMTVVVSTGAFAQGRGKGQDKQRPPKPPVKIIDGKGGGKPPQPPQRPPKDKKP